MTTGPRSGRISIGSAEGASGFRKCCFCARMYSGGETSYATASEKTGVSDLTPTPALPSAAVATRRKTAPMAAANRHAAGILRIIETSFRTRQHSPGPAPTAIRLKSRSHPSSSRSRPVQPSSLYPAKSSRSSREVCASQRRARFGARPARAFEIVLFLEQAKDHRRNLANLNVLETQLAMQAFRGRLGFRRSEPVPPGRSEDAPSSKAVWSRSASSKSRMASPASAASPAWAAPRNRPRRSSRRRCSRVSVPTREGSELRISKESILSLPRTGRE